MAHLVSVYLSIQDLTNHKYVRLMFFCWIPVSPMYSTHFLLVTMNDPEHDYRNWQHCIIMWRFKKLLPDHEIVGLANKSTSVNVHVLIVR